MSSRDIQVKGIVGPVIVVSVRPVIKDGLALAKIGHGMPANHLVFEGAVETLILALGLGMIGSPVGDGDPVESLINNTKWNGNYLPPTGSYWSGANGLGKGHDAYGLVEVKPKDGGQWGASLAMAGQTGLRPDLPPPPRERRRPEGGRVAEREGRVDRQADGERHVAEEPHVPHVAPSPVVGDRELAGAEALDRATVPRDAHELLEDVGLGLGGHPDRVQDERPLGRPPEPRRQPRDEDALRGRERCLREEGPRAAGAQRDGAPVRLQVERDGLVVRGHGFGARGHVLLFSGGTHLKIRRVT